MHLVCPQCGAKNRVAADKLSHEVACGRCQTDLMAAEPVALGDAALPGFLKGTELPVVVDFWAAWCGPCKAMAPQFAATARAMPRVRCVKVDTDAAPQASARYQIRSIPTLILFHQGQEVARLSGAVSAAELQRWISAHPLPVPA
ncbi:MAG: thioredoxin TrxC [Burkholderiaceae bacterium]|nr:thioredoxin TrxC [Burkholderiaceae bacterium]